MARRCSKWYNWEFLERNQEGKEKHRVPKDGKTTISNFCKHCGEILKFLVFDIAESLKACAEK